MFSVMIPADSSGGSSYGMFAPHALICGGVGVASCDLPTMSTL